MMTIIVPFMRPSQQVALRVLPVCPSNVCPHGLLSRSQNSVKNKNWRKSSFG